MRTFSACPLREPLGRGGLGQRLLAYLGMVCRMSRSSACVWRISPDIGPDNDEKTSVCCVQDGGE